MRDLSGAQTRQLVDAEQAYESWRAAERDYRVRYRGSLTWKSVKGRRYLYRKTDDRWVAVGPEDDATRDIFDAFRTGRDASKERRESLDRTLREMAPINRATRLGRVPWMAARILRRLDRLGVLGHGLRVVGTHALYAYERMGGVHFGADIVATLDVDLLYDARGGIDLVSSGLADLGLLGLLQRLDGSFSATAPNSFRAANASGFMVDLITPASTNPATRSFRDRLGDMPDDLAAVEIAGLGWLESSPAVERVAIDERGFPLTIAAPDPRAFACHKLWLATRDDRDPLKRRRDEAQAQAVIDMLATRLPSLSFDDPALTAMPQALRDRAAALAAEACVAIHGEGSDDWA